MALQLSDFWTWRGRVSRAKYAGLGIVLFAVKHNLDRFLAAWFGYPWRIFNYWTFDDERLTSLSSERAVFFLTLLIVALPFIWVGVVLTVRRLRDAELPLWLVLFFFLPFVNIFFFLLLSIIPGRSNNEPRHSAVGSGFRRTLLRIIPDSEIGSAAMGLLVTVILGVTFTLLGVYGLGIYGWGLFVGIPFFLGLNSVLIYGFHRPRTAGKCLLVSLLAVAFASIALLALAIEGVVCLVMAAPLATGISAFGGFIGYLLQQRETFSAESLHVFSLLLVLFPALMLFEHAGAPESPLYEVRSVEIIAAPPEEVWKNVVSFSELPEPDGWFFRTGIAYPRRAEINGRGAGAVRHCVFSTGAFVEPISVWDEPRQLRFGVESQPPVMNEWSPYRDLAPPHLEHYLTSREGQFLLTALPDGRTRLEGTTWYQNRFWPGRYWRIWSDVIIHRIHRRVLTHIKNLSERREDSSTVRRP